MFQQDSADIDDFSLVIVLSVQRILEVTDPHDFLQWARETFPQLIEFQDHLDSTDMRRITTALACAIWNATPLPKYGFTLRPLPTPAPTARCFCGSGLRYRDCCANLTGMPELSTDITWEILLTELSDEELRRALACQAVPEPLLAFIAMRWLGADRPRRVVALLEPLFTPEVLPTLDARYELAFDTLCDAYNALDYSRKKNALLNSVCANGCNQLQAAAWQRRCTMHMEKGDFEQAEDAFMAALRSQPDNPDTAVLEISLRTAQNQIALAQERAQFWWHRLQRAGCEEQSVLAFLEHAMTDPQGALMLQDATVTGLPLLVDLRKWIAQQSQRPIPTYQIRELPKRQCALVAPSALEKLKKEWRKLFPIAKSSDAQLILFERTVSMVWEHLEWLSYLLEQPELADDLDVLDDLVIALDVYPQTELPWIGQILLWPLLNRAWAIITQNLPLNHHRELLWDEPFNQAALRLLFRRYRYQIQVARTPKDAMTTLETMLRINTNDHYGARADLMNLYLRAGNNEQAVELAQQFPDDTRPEIAYGKVLALYRLGFKERAQSVLATAIRQMPKIPIYLTRNHMKQPKHHSFGITENSDVVAWDYREEMRDVWMAEPGALDWLKRQTA